MARIMVPSTPETRGEVESKDTASSGPGEQTGRLYLPSADPKAEKDRVSGAVDQALLAAGAPPSKEEIRAAKAAQKAEEKSDKDVSAPVESASEQGGAGPRRKDSKAAKAAAKSASETATASTGSALVADNAASTTTDDVVGEASEAGGPAPLPQPKGSASREDWAEYARSRGATDEDLEGKSRNDIRDEYHLI